MVGSCLGNRVSRRRRSCRLGARGWGLEERWLTEMTVQVSGDVSPKKARPGRGKGLRNTHSVRQYIPRSCGLRGLRKLGLPQRWWVEMNGRNRVRVLDPTGAQGQGSVQASWLGWAASWPEGVGSGTGSRARTWESRHARAPGGGEGSDERHVPVFSK